MLKYPNKAFGCQLNLDARAVMSKQISIRPSIIVEMGHIVGGT